MDDDDLITQFTSITSATAARARQYLSVADNDLAQAIQLFFENDGADMSGGPASQHPPPAGTTSSSSARGDQADPVRIDSDDDEHAHEDDEAMARRLQDEMYGGGAGAEIDPETGVRRPVARTAETLAGPAAGFAGGAFAGFTDAEDLQEAAAEQMALRRLGREARAGGGGGGARPGIFNQHHSPDSSAIWNDDPSTPSSSSANALFAADAAGLANPSQRRAHLSRATGGASESSSKSSMLAEMYRPPTELISPIRTWEGVRAAGKEDSKWILINIQDANIFDCQVLNRDIWKDARVRETVRAHFLFKQYGKHDPQAASYIRFYFPLVDSEAAYPHVAIVDPRTGEQVKVWSGAPAPKPADFLMQLHEFLDRYSLDAGARNPVATRRPERPRAADPDRMTEDEQMQAALQASLEGGVRRASGPRPDDPDELTRAAAAAGGSGGSASTPATLDNDGDAEEGGGGVSAFFASIAADQTPAEPAADAPGVTRVQFRHPGGRVIRRFTLDSPVRLLYEWLKGAAPSPLGDSRTGAEFELVSMGRNLAGAAGQGETVEQAGLRNGTVMVEFV